MLREPVWFVFIYKPIEDEIVAEHISLAQTSEEALSETRDKLGSAFDALSSVVIGMHEPINKRLNQLLAWFREIGIPEDKWDEMRNEIARVLREPLIAD